MLNIFIKKRFFHLRCLSTGELTRNLAINKPIEWNHLIKWLDDGQKYPLWRDTHNTQRYFEHQKLISKEYKSINDFIRIHYLKWDVDIDRATKKCVAIPSENSIKEPLVTPNAFPYYLVDGIQHWLIWCDPMPKEPEKIIEHVMNREFHSEKFERFFFINPQRLRSISGVFHAHVFTREIKK
ncbi:unnamed protein product [Rotaria socialis]|uniref:Uncharacterized protein n=1 Tax=Rotaria socialis TaxID=392032 RepID=A0A821KH72_9BILA|nr:unnamed protein product [Rotaria socialis]CAF3377566.1 unnamed protein product [Rotaria socialis]CAF3687847.1 unnamed protein product [Rotaria socialis]CAF3709922.1 unnamed protein product [Rotaria socialis]CAF3786956.1 unnamed protein product [Rotaria socialis]